MTDLNSVVIVGRLTQDIDLKYTTSGMAVANGSIAVNRDTVRNSERVKETSFFNISMFGKLAENLKPYLTKGKQVAIIGGLTQDRWKDQNGNNRSSVKIIVNEIQLIGGRSENNSANNQQNYSQNTQARPVQQDFDYDEYDQTYDNTYVASPTF